MDRNPAFAARQLVGRIQETVDTAVPKLPVRFVQGRSLEKMQYDFNSKSVVLTPNDPRAKVESLLWVPRNSSEILGNAVVKAAIGSRVLYGTSGVRLGQQSSASPVRKDEPVFFREPTVGGTVFMWQARISKGVGASGSSGELQVIWALDRALEIERFKMSFAEAERRFGAGSAINGYSWLVLENLQAVGTIPPARIGSGNGALVIMADVADVAIVTADGDVLADSSVLMPALAAYSGAAGQRAAQAEAAAARAAEEAARAEAAATQSAEDAQTALKDCLNRPSREERLQCVTDACKNSSNMAQAMECDKTRATASRMTHTPAQRTAALDECSGMASVSERVSCVRDACGGPMSDAERQRCSSAQMATSQPASAGPAMPAGAAVEACLQKPTGNERQVCIQQVCRTAVSAEKRMECNQAKMRAMQMPTNVDHAAVEACKGKPAMQEQMVCVQEACGGMYNVSAEDRAICQQALQEIFLGAAR